MSDSKERRNYILNKSLIAVPFYPELGEKNADPLNQIHVREVGQGLIPSEDVQKLVEAAELAVDSGFTDGERRLGEALAEFKAKYPGGGND